MIKFRLWLAQKLLPELTLVSIDEIVKEKRQEWVQTQLDAGNTVAMQYEVITNKEWNNG